MEIITRQKKGLWTIISSKIAMLNSIAGILLLETSYSTTDGVMYSGDFQLESEAIEEW